MDPLADLRGFHLPEAVSWWPPAPGWWLLGLLGLVLVALSVHWFVTGYRRGAASRAARAELAVLCGDFRQDRDAVVFARGLSRLLRRFALCRFPGRGAAGLTGEDWLAFLDAHGGGGRFAEGPGRLLVEAPYRSAAERPADELDADELADLVRDWIRRNGGACG